MIKENEDDAARWVDVITRLQQSGRDSLRDGRQLIWEVLQENGKAGTSAMNLGQQCREGVKNILWLIVGVSPPLTDRNFET